MISSRYLSLTWFFNASCDSQKLLSGTLSLTSQAGTESSGQDDDDLENGFSKFGTSTTSDLFNESHAVHENEDDLICESELSEEDAGNIREAKPQNELEVSGVETDDGKRALQ